MVVENLDAAPILQTTGRFPFGLIILFSPSCITQPGGLLLRAAVVSVDLFDFDRKHGEMTVF
jgi:hypothetical protein